MKVRKPFNKHFFCHNLILNLKKVEYRLRSLLTCKGVLLYLFRPLMSAPLCSKCKTASLSPLAAALQSDSTIEFIIPKQQTIYIYANKNQIKVRKYNPCDPGSQQVWKTF